MILDSFTGVESRGTMDGYWTSLITAKLHQLPMDASRQIAPPGLSHNQRLASRDTWRFNGMLISAARYPAQKAEYKMPVWRVIR